MERELELQIQMKAESEMAAKLLEKDIHEKQDTIVSLRRQLEDIKIINLEMYTKLQVRLEGFYQTPMTSFCWKFDSSVIKPQIVKEAEFCFNFNNEFFLFSED